MNDLPDTLEWLTERLDALERRVAVRAYVTERSASHKKKKKKISYDVIFSVISFLYFYMIKANSIQDASTKANSQSDKTSFKLYMKKDGC